MQKLVAVCHTVWAYVGVPKNGSCWGVAELEMHPTHVNVPNLVAVGKTI